MKKKIMQTITRGVAVNTYGDSGYWVMEIGKRNYTLNIQVVRRYRFDGQRWEQISSWVDKID